MAAVVAVRTVMGSLSILTGFSLPSVPSLICTI
jgi:hypothetical protein